MKIGAMALAGLFSSSIFFLPVTGRTAELPPANPGVERFASTIDVALSGGVAMLFGDICERDADVVGCTSAMILPGVQAEAHIRIPASFFALGLVGSTSFEVDHSQTCTESGCQKSSLFTLFRLAAEPRFYPVRGRSAELFLALEVGLMGTVEKGVTHLGLDIGAAIGVDIALGDHFFLGGELRGLLHAMPGQDASMPEDGGRTELPLVVGPSLGLLKLGWRFPV